MNPLITILLIIFHIIVTIRAQEVKIIAPLVITELSEENVILYETTAKLFFDIPFPTRSAAGLLVTGLARCSDSGQNPSAWCPIQFHLQRLADELLDKITPTNLKPSTSTVPYFNQESHLCDKIGKHFPTRNMDATLLADYLAQISNCPAPMHSSNMPFPIYDLPAPYRQAMLDFAIPFWQPPPTLAENGTYAAVNSALITAGMLHHLAEKLAWTEAMSDCAAAKVPVSLISEANLNLELTDLRVKANSYSYRFSVDDGTHGAGHYYNLPIADCTFKDATNSLLVRILVPVVGILSDWVLEEAKPIPFRHVAAGSPYICTHKDENINRNGLIFARDKATYPTTKKHTKPSCTTTDGVRICNVEKEQEMSWEKDCLQFILDDADDVPNIVEFCPLTCTRIEVFNLPVVQIVRPDEYYIAGDHTYGIAKICGGSSDGFIYLPEEGALHVRIPCTCKLVLSPTRELVPGTPCGVDWVEEIVRPINLQR